MVNPLKPAVAEIKNLRADTGMGLAEARRFLTKANLKKALDGVVHLDSGSDREAVYRAVLIEVVELL